MSSTPTLVAGRYRLGPELGSGGMGVVWEAYDELLHRTVAVKEVRYPAGITDEERDKLARRTLREARAVAAVEDPHAVRVFDIVEQDGRPWLVMELVRGRTLTEVIRDRGALAEAEVARIGLALLDALRTAHSAGVLHRDVKPSNVILGEDGRVALTDFGIATVDSDPSDLTTSGQLVGSPAYMAPERARGERPTPASDLWSLGATLWTAAEGRPPYVAGNAFATMTKVCTEDPPACARCDGELGALLGQMMAREPADRPSLDDARRQLETLGSSAPQTAPTQTSTTPYPTEPLPPSFDRTVALERPITPASPGPQTPVAPLAAEAEVAPVAPVGRRRSAVPLLAGMAVLLAIAGVVAGYLVTRSNGAAAGGSASPPAQQPSTHAKGSASATPSTAALAGGLRRYTDPSVGWSIGVPAGWQVQRESSGTYLRDPSGGRYLQIDTKYPAGPSAKGAWEDEERTFRAQHAGYHRIRLESVSWRGYPDVADWEFTYTDGGASLHAVDRGAVVGNRGYGLFFQTHSNQWAASQSLLDELYASFSPR